MEDSYLLNWIMTHWLISILIGTFVYLNIGYLITWISLKVVQTYATWDGSNFQVKVNALTFLFLPFTIIHWNNGEKFSTSDDPPVLETLKQEDKFHTYKTFIPFVWPIKLGFMILGIIIGLLYFGFVWGDSPLLWRILTLPIRWLLPKLQPKKKS